MDRVARILMVSFLLLGAVRLLIYFNFAGFVALWRYATESEVTPAVLASPLVLYCAAVLLGLAFLVRVRRIKPLALVAATGVVVVMLAPGAASVLNRSLTQLGILEPEHYVLPGIDGLGREQSP
jgi:hypothetical protein